MIHDNMLLGVCGETELANAKQSLVTMMQLIGFLKFDLTVMVLTF